MKTRTYDIRVAGVTFNDRQSILGELRGGEPTRIVPEPDNIYDANALAVHVAHNGEIVHIGYVPKQIAKIIAPYLEGETVMCRDLQITGGFQTSAGEQANFGARFIVEIPHDGGIDGNLQNS